MAAEQILQGLSEDFLQCAICVNRFQNPLMPPCLHSFCSWCLEKRKATAWQQLSCPTCRRCVHLPSTGLKGLPSNFLLTSLMERLDLVGRLTNGKYSGCDFCKNSTNTRFCTDCQLHVCVTCKFGHSRIPGGNEHVMIAADKVSDVTYLKQVTSKKPPRCPYHNQEKLRFYCTTCSKLVCRDCTIVNHQGHKLYEAERVVVAAKTSLELHLKQSQSLVQKTQQSCKKLHDVVKLTQTHKATLTSQIENQYEKYVKKLNTQRDVLYEELRKVTEENSKQIAETLSLTTEWIKANKNTQKLTTQILEGNNTWEILGIASDLIRSYRTLTQEYSGVMERSKNAEAETSTFNKMKFTPTTSLYSHRGGNGRGLGDTSKLLGSFSKFAPPLELERAVSELRSVGDVSELGNVWVVRVASNVRDDRQSYVQNWRARHGFSNENNYQGRIQDF